jgi:hypothetical protein
VVHPKLGAVDVVDGVDRPVDVEVIAPLRWTATGEYRGVSFVTDFVRDDAGNVAWIRCLGRLVPRAM